MPKLRDDEWLRLPAWDYAAKKKAYAEIRVGDLAALRPHIPPIIPPDVFIQLSSMASADYPTLEAAIKMEKEVNNFKNDYVAREAWVKTDVILKNGTIIWTALTNLGVHKRLEEGNPKEDN